MTIRRSHEREYSGIRRMRIVVQTAAGGCTRRLRHGEVVERVDCGANRLDCLRARRRGTLATQLLVTSEMLPKFGKYLQIFAKIDKFARVSFSGKCWRSRSRLYRSQFVQVSICFCGMFQDLHHDSTRFAHFCIAPNSNVQQISVDK